MGAAGKKPNRWLGVLFGLLVLASGLQFLPFALSYPDPDLPDGLTESQVAAYQQAAQHLMPLIHARCFARAVSLLAFLAVLVSGFPRRIEAHFGSHSFLRWPARLLFFWLLLAWLTVVHLPYDYWVFLHNRSFGISEMTSMEWWINAGKGLVVPLMLFPLKGVLLFCLIALCGKRWWIVAVMVMFLLFSVVPEWLSRKQPIDLVEKREPLPAGEIRTEFEALAEQTGRHLELVMVDQSKRSVRVNMALTGRLGREFLEVTDTLLDALTPAEARAMLAHELGHDVTRHLTLPLRKGLGLGAMLLTYYLVYLWYRRQAVPRRSILTCIVKILLVAKLVGFVTEPLIAAVNRYQEREADLYALKLTGDAQALESLLLTVAEINLEPYDVPTWAFYLYGSTHPTVARRVESARAYAGGGSTELDE